MQKRALLGGGGLFWSIVLSLCYTSMSLYFSLSFWLRCFYHIGTLDVAEGSHIHGEM